MKNLGRIIKAKLYLEKGWAYNAALELAEHIYENKGKINKLEFRNFLGDDEWEIVRIEALKRLEKGCNILSYGTIWNEDELLLVFSILIDIYLLNELGKAFDKSLDLRLDKLKSYLPRINLKLSKNFSAVNSVAKTLDKNLQVKNWRQISDFDKLFI